MSSGLRPELDAGLAYARAALARELAQERPDEETCATLALATLGILRARGVAAGAPSVSTAYEDSQPAVINLEQARAKSNTHAPLAQSGYRGGYSSHTNLRLRLYQGE
ncbi:MAG: hypothetical protein Q4G03_10980 [Planctomycetia bacterium]|nr:hypothetical protein [Planctomycetia bacterium]